MKRSTIPIQYYFPIDLKEINPSCGPCNVKNRAVCKLRSDVSSNVMVWSASLPEAPDDWQPRRQHQRRYNRVFGCRARRRTVLPTSAPRLCIARTAVAYSLGVFVVYYQRGSRHRIRRYFLVKNSTTKAIPTSCPSRASPL